VKLGSIVFGYKAPDEKLVRLSQQLRVRMKDCSVALTPVLPAARVVVAAAAVESDRPRSLE
jgi:hypothetical protein